MRGGTTPLDALGDDGRAVAVEAAALSLLVPWDHVLVGRAIQALCNALCIPLVYVLGRQAGLPAGAAAAGSLLLMAVPEFQEFAWRFWTDSQATLLALALLALLAACVRRPSLPAAVGSVLVLALLLVTKDSAGVVLAPFVPLAWLAAAARHLPPPLAWRALAAAAGVGVLGLAALLLAGPLAARLPGSGLVERVAGVAQRVAAGVPRLVSGAPAFADELAALFGPFEVSVAFLWAWALGGLWLLPRALRSDRRERPRDRAGWLLAALAWLPLVALPLRRLWDLGTLEARMGLALALALAALATWRPLRAITPGLGWGFALLGLVTLAVTAQRLLLRAAPDLPVAFTVRSFMPVLPLLALLAGAGLWAAVGGALAMLPRARAAHGAATVIAAALLVAAWSPLLRERTTTQPLLGRAADRGADPTTPQGLRVEALVEAERWLLANVGSDDRVATTIPRHLAWYADLGVDGMARLVNLGAHARTPGERRPLIMDLAGPGGVDYVVDFNVAWTAPGSEDARQWRQTYAWLASRPWVEMAYVRRDSFGHPVLYVARNHGPAQAFSYVDREAARAEQAARR